MSLGGAQIAELPTRQREEGPVVSTAGANSERCFLQFVPSVARLHRYRSNHVMIDRFTVLTAIQANARAAVTIVDRAEEVEAQDAGAGKRLGPTA